MSIASETTTRDVTPPEPHVTVGAETMILVENLVKRYP